MTRQQPDWLTNGGGAFVTKYVQSLGYAPTWIESATRTPKEDCLMPAPHTETNSSDAVEGVVPMIPVVLPLAGAVLIFLLAFIAVSMA
jgi:hypothetical protein